MIPCRAVNAMEKKVDLVRVKALLPRLGIGRATLYRWIDDPGIAFPRPIRIGGRAVAFEESAIAKWLASRAAAPALQQAVVE